MVTQELIQKYEALLGRINRPSQYLGNELNVVKKDFDAASIRVCLIFPDKYEIGMSHVGLKILYHILNKIPDVVCERAYAPDLDLEGELRKEGLPLFSWESKRSLRDFDILGFSFTYELTYTNFLNILDLSGIPLWQKDRSAQDPLVLGGGGCMMNAEPLADFLDAAALGDGEDLIVDMIDCVREWKRLPTGRGGVTPPVHAVIAPMTENGRENPAPTKNELLNQLSEIEGIYIPSFFNPEYNEDGTLKKMHPLKKGYERINKRVVKDLNSAPYPTELLVPITKLVHDRIGIEIQRGCNRACRFCQAGYIDRPVRQRSPETVLNIAKESLEKTGIEEISLLSLSAADYATLVPLLKTLNQSYSKDKVVISVPATRTEKLTPDLIEQLKKVRKTGFTIAPEAGSEKMRRVINKGNKVDDLYTAVENAFKAGWDLLKLYYMVGLPFEEDDDVVGIAREANDSIKICFGYSKRSQLKLGVSSFVPKPHTPFQWNPQMTIDETYRRYHLIKTNLQSRRVYVSHHNPEMSYVEGIFSRGDRRVGGLIYLAFQAGCRFDEWKEHFDFSKWELVLSQWDFDPGFYLHRHRYPDEVLPWDHLFAQMDKKFLWEEFEKAHDVVKATSDVVRQAHHVPIQTRKSLTPKSDQLPGFTEDCSVERCSNCGVCDYREIKNRIYVVGEEAVVPQGLPLVVQKKGHREWYGWWPSRGGVTPPVQDEVTSPMQQLSSIQNQAPVFKIRIRYSKTGLARFMGHLEVMNVFRRALKRLKLPIVYSQGFHPHMKISASPPLALGIESDWEFLDVQLHHFVDPTLLKEKLFPTLPGGLKIIAVSVIDTSMPSLYGLLPEFYYQASFVDLSKRWSDKVLEGVEKFKEQDVKKLVNFDLTNLPEIFGFSIKNNPTGSIKPFEVVKGCLGMMNSDLEKICIKKIGIENYV